MNYKHIAALFYLSLNSIIFANNKQYDIYIYDTFKGFTITVEEDEVSIDPINFGVFLLKETLTYKNQLFNDDNLIIQLLSDKKIEPLDTVWIKNTSILDGVVVDVRFLFSDEEEILSNDKKILNQIEKTSKESLYLKIKFKF